MAMKRPTRKTELRRWMDERYKKTPGLKKRVATLVEEVLIEQKRIGRRREHGLSQRALARRSGRKP